MQNLLYLTQYIMCKYNPIERLMTLCYHNDTRRWANVKPTLIGSMSRALIGSMSRVSWDSFFQLFFQHCFFQHLFQPDMKMFFVFERKITIF